MHTEEVSSSTIRKQRSAIGSPASRRATNCSLSSMTEHSFQGIHFLLRKGGSVAYVSGTFCHLCVGSLNLHWFSYFLCFSVDFVLWPNRSACRLVQPIPVETLCRPWALNRGRQLLACPIQWSLAAKPLGAGRGEGRMRLSEMEYRAG